MPGGGFAGGFAGLGGAQKGYLDAQSSFLSNDQQLQQLREMFMGQGADAIAGNFIKNFGGGAPPDNLYGAPGPTLPGAPPGAGPAPAASPPYAGPAPPQPPMGAPPGMGPVPMGPPAPGPVGDRFPAVPMAAGSQPLGQALRAPPPGTVMNPQARPPMPPQPQGGPQGPPQGGPPPGPPPGPPGGGGMPPGFSQPIDLRTAITELQRQNPNAPPEILFKALQKLAPVLNQDSRLQLQQMQMMLAQERLMQGDRRQDETERHNQATEQAAKERLDAQNRKYEITYGAKPTLKPETLDFYAERALLGDKNVASQLGSGTQGAANKAALADRITELAAERGMSPQDMVANSIGIVGANQMARTVGNIIGRMEVAGENTAALIPQAKQAAKLVDRTQYPSINKLLLLADEQIGDPNVVAFKLAMQGLANEYAAVINRGYQPTEGSRAQAVERLNAAWNNNQLDAAFDRIKIETDAVRNSAQKVMINIRKYNPTVGGETPGAGVPGKQLVPIPASDLKAARDALNAGTASMQEIIAGFKAAGMDTSGIEAQLKKK